MGVRVILDEGKLMRRIKKGWNKTLTPLSEQILADCNNYCKQDTGNLIASSQANSQPQKGKLIWKTPYAKRQYWKIRTASRDKNPQATWRWCETAKRADLKSWNKLADKLMKENT